MLIMLKTIAESLTVEMEMPLHSEAYVQLMEALEEEEAPQEARSNPAERTRMNFACFMDYDPFVSDDGADAATGGIHRITSEIG